jgi:hypothetical protein
MILTRVVTDDDCCVEAVQLQSALHAIERELRDVPGFERHYIADALLNFAVACITHIDHDADRLA